MRDATSVIQNLAKRRERNFLPALHRLNKNVARKCRCANSGRPMQMGRRGAMAGQRYVARNFRDIGIRSEFNIENMKLFRGWLGGWLRLRWNFKAENVRERSVITSELSMATRRINSHWKRKTQERNSQLHIPSFWCRNAINFP